MTLDDPSMSAGWPGVSVIMPVRNEERHLAAAVAEVLAQDYPGEIGSDHGRRARVTTARA